MEVLAVVEEWDKNSMLKNISFTLALLSVGLSFGQTNQEILSYGFQDTYGSARVISMSGAFTALGGDPSSVSLNPAGMGIKRLSEFSASLGGNFNFANSTFLVTNEKNSTNRSTLTIPSINYVSVNNNERNKDWRRTNWSFGINKRGSFQENILTGGTGRFKSYLNSITDRLNANSIDVSQLNGVNLTAFNTFMIDSTSNNSYISGNGSDIQRTHLQIENTGNIIEPYINVSTSYKEKFFIGASIEIPLLNRNSRTVITEDNITIPNDVIINNTINKIVRSEIAEEVTTSGSALKGSIGLLYRPSKHLRLGFAYHSPYKYQMQEYIFIDARNTFDINQPLRFNIISNTYDYNLKMPSKINAGAAILFGKKGLFSIDIDYTDNSKIRYSTITKDFSSDQIYFDNLNNNIEEFLGKTFSTRFGGEINLNRNYRFRLGGSFSTSPTKNDEASNRIGGSLGFGYAKKGFSIDLGTSITNFKQTYSLYNTVESKDLSYTEQNTTNIQFLTSISYKIR